MKTKAEIKKACEKMAQQTDDNDHTGALITLARLAELNEFEKVFKGIKVLHNIEGSMPSELSAYRRRKAAEMWNLMDCIFSGNDLQMIKESF